MQIYIARQPIFDVDKRVKAYELLYRSSETNAFDCTVSGDKATCRLLSQALVDFGIQTVTENKKAYVNFTEPLLMSKLPLLLDKQLFILEVLEDVDFNDAVVKRLKSYHDSGYIIALDDYCGTQLRDDVLENLDILKVDFMKTTPAIRAQISRNVAGRHIMLLAEKVETDKDFEEAVSLGCKLFQGYYLSRPLVLQKKALQISQASEGKLFRLISGDAYDVDQLADIIRVDVHLTHKLLQKMRTARYYRGQVVSSVKDALVRMGMDETRRWITLILMQDLTGSDGDEQIRTALVRATFCETMAKEKKNRQLSNDAFLSGMFSVLEAEGEEIEELLSVLDVSKQVSETLVYKKDNELTIYLRTAMWYENHDWNQLLRLYPEKQMAKLQSYYLKAIKYADEVF